jgi:hypothetical protein
MEGIQTFLKFNENKNNLPEPLGYNKSRTEHLYKKHRTHKYHNDVPQALIKIRTRKLQTSKEKKRIKISPGIHEIETKNNAISGTKSWFFENVNKIDKPLTKLSKRRRKKTQVKGEKGDYHSKYQ